MADSALIGAAWRSQSLWHQPLLSPLGGMPVNGGGGRLSRRPSTADCEEHYFTQTLDHFRHAPGQDEETFQQRYFLCRDFWRPAHERDEDFDDDDDEDDGDGNSGGRERRGNTRGVSGARIGTARGGETAPAGAKGPIFFYTGNEADVSLYVGATGLMWENAPAFNALLVFAEHRFYGKSLPFGAPDKGREFLSTAQALADYARLISALGRDLGAEDSPVVAFGGSYGGMLSSWLRLKYPHIVQGAVAASAPVLALEGLLRPTPNPESFAETVTRAAGPAGGAVEECSGNVRRAFATVISGNVALNGESRKDVRNDARNDARNGGADDVAADDVNLDDDVAADDVARSLRICPGQEPRGEDALLQLAWWARAAFDYLSMGNYPYPTGYILNSGGDEGGVELPSWPLRVACSHLADPELQTKDSDVLLGALADAIGVYYNATGDVECFSPEAGANNASSIDADNWNWQACTEISMPMSTDGERDMFWRAEWDPIQQASHCREQFGVSPREGWAAAEYGGYDSWSQVTNVVFSNGRLDPWSGMGVLDQQQAGSGVVVILMDQAAHHIDLFFEHPLDPDEVREARRKEMDHVEDWVREAYRKTAASSDVGVDDEEVGSSSSAGRGGGVVLGRKSAKSWLESMPRLTADW